MIEGGLEYRQKIKGLQVGEVSQSAASSLVQRIQLSEQFPRGLKKPLLTTNSTKGLRITNFLNCVNMGSQLAYYTDRNLGQDPRQLLYCSDEFQLQTLYREFGSVLEGDLEHASDAAFLFAFHHASYTLYQLRALGAVSLWETPVCPIIRDLEGPFRMKIDWYRIDGYGDICEAIQELRATCAQALFSEIPINIREVMRTLHFFNMSYIQYTQWSKHLGV